MSIIFTLSTVALIQLPLGLDDIQESEPERILSDSVRKQLLWCQVGQEVYFQLDNLRAIVTTWSSQLDEVIKLLSAQCTL